MYEKMTKRWGGGGKPKPEKELLSHNATKLSFSQDLTEKNVQNQLPKENHYTGVGAFWCCFPSHQFFGCRLLDRSWHSNITRRCVWMEYKEVEIQQARTRTVHYTRTILHADALQIKEVKPVGSTKGWKGDYTKYHRKNQLLPEL